jgi:hypothetical protein
LLADVEGRSPLGVSSEREEGETLCPRPPVMTPR